MKQILWKSSTDLESAGGRRLPAVQVKQSNVNTNILTERLPVQIPAAADGDWWRVSDWRSAFDLSCAQLILRLSLISDKSSKVEE